MLAIFSSIALFVVFIFIARKREDSLGVSIRYCVLSYILTELTIMGLFILMETSTLGCIVPCLVMLGIFFSNTFWLHDIGAGIAVVSLCSVIGASLFSAIGALIGVAIGYIGEYCLQMLLKSSFHTITVDDFYRTVFNGNLE